MSASPPVMIGLQMPESQRWSARVITVLGLNPGLFTGPGTNTYLVGTGRERILLDTGEGRPAYLDLLARSLEAHGNLRIQEIVLTHGHPDHMGGVAGVAERHGALRVSKHPGSGTAGEHGAHGAARGTGAPLRWLAEGDVVETEGATLRALHTPGHADDHLCFLLEEEQALFSGDNVLGVGTTVIPGEGGDLSAYLDSLARMRELDPGAIYPAHGPRIAEGRAKIEEYIAHRLARDAQILDALAAGCATLPEIVSRVYAAYPQALHAPAMASVTAHLVKLEREGRAVRDREGPALQARWSARS